MEAKKEKFKPASRVRPDAKGRITLGRLAQGVSSYDVSEDGEGRLLLTPMAEIPAREQWLFKNKEALGSVRRGLDDARAGKLVRRASFAKHADSDPEE